MILFEDVSKKFGQHTVLDNVNLEIRPGDFTTITGPSGSGKTTLIHLVIGATNPSEGRVIAMGKEVHLLSHEELQNLRRRIGTIFQDYKLLPSKTVFENIAFILEVCGYPLHEIALRALKLLERVGLKEHADKYPHQLSGGEAQRTAIARALAHEPQMLMADEPTGNLDPENSLNIMKLLLELHKQGLTILLTTHAPELLKLAPKKIFELKNGRLKKFA